MSTLSPIPSASKDFANSSLEISRRVWYGVLMFIYAPVSPPAPQMPMLASSVPVEAQSARARLSPTGEGSRRAPNGFVVRIVGKTGSAGETAGTSPRSGCRWLRRRTFLSKPARAVERDLSSSRAAATAALAPSCSQPSRPNSPESALLSPKTCFRDKRRSRVAAPATTGGRFLWDSAVAPPARVASSRRSSPSRAQRLHSLLPPREEARTTP